MTCHSSTNAIIDSLELEKGRLRQAHPDWSDERLRLAFARRTENILSYLVNNSEMPRSIQQDLARGPGLGLVHDGSSASINSDSSTHDPPARDGLIPVPMTRANFSSPTFLNEPGGSSTALSFSASSTGSKRAYHQTGMGHSASYTFGLEPLHRTDPTLTPSTTAHDFHDAQSFEPDEYVKLLGDIDGGTGLSVIKKPKLDRVAGALPYAIATSLDSYSPFVMTPSSSVSTTVLSPYSLTQHESMSRQSSATNLSVTDRLDMLRLGSFSSVASDLNPLFEDDDLELSILSCSTEKALGEHPPYPFLPEGGDVNSFCAANDGSTQFPFLPVETGFSFTVNDDPSRTPEQFVPSASPAEDMQRSDSDRSTSSTSSHRIAVSTKRRAITRQRKHIENAKQAIAMKSLPSGPKSQPTTADLQTRPIQPLDPSSRRKEPIVRTPYIRPQHPRLFCSDCADYPDGFKGEHELRRHRDRKHTRLRKEWICTHPAERTEHWPKSPLDICKHCMKGKTYSADYNAAAHIRRVHFVPCKRGRRARGEPRESRAGKAGGDWPPIDWLKETGWLTEVEVGASVPGMMMTMKMETTGPSRDTTTPVPDRAEPDSFPNPDLRLRHAVDDLGYGSVFAPAADDFAFFPFSCASESLSSSSSSSPRGPGGGERNGAEDPSLPSPSSYMADPLSVSVMLTV